MGVRQNLLKLTYEGHRLILGYRGAACGEVAPVALVWAGRRATFETHEGGLRESDTRG
jgi:hypothetical protein